MLRYSYFDAAIRAPLLLLRAPLYVAIIFADADAAFAGDIADVAACHTLLMLMPPYAAATCQPLRHDDAAAFDYATC